MHGKPLRSLDVYKRQVYETTEIYKETLPVSVQEKISQGYVLTSKQELYSFLENFSS